MAKEHFDYSKCKKTDYSYYGFHLKNGRYHIDTKRIINLGYKGCFPEELFNTPRNTHYFIPKHKYAADYSVNILKNCLNKLSEEWNCEYKNAIEKIKTPEDVQRESRTEQIMYTSSSDDLDDIEFEVLMNGIRRIPTYNHVIKSIHLQYIQRIFVDFFRCIWIAIKRKGKTLDNKLEFSDFLDFVPKYLTSPKDKQNPLRNLPHFKYFYLLNKIDNFLKHHSDKSYRQLANNPYDDNIEIKEFLSKYVYSAEEAGFEYESGMYAGDWIKIEPTFINEILGHLNLFAEELCSLLYNENANEALWNSDETLLKYLKDIIYF